MNITELMKKARQLGRDEHAAGEDKKLGTLRAGSSGILDKKTGEIAGACHRKSHLRSLGIELEEPTEDKLIMFELGYANETVIVDQLRSVLSTGQDGYVVLQEEEIPIEWLTTNGTKVTGRPDAVICTKELVDKINFQDDMEFKSLQAKYTPVLGLEFKSVHSLWTAREVLFGQAPKLDHLIQAAHYMWKLGVPYKLIYKSYSQLGQGMAGNEWIIKQFPRPGEPGSDYVEYSYRTSKKTGQETATIKHIKQFEIVYDLRLENGRLQYCPEGSNEWFTTIVDVASIEAYYNYVADLGNKKDLGPRPATIKLDGEKANYSNCNYCPMQPVCDKTESLGYDKWLEAVRVEVSKK